MMKKVILLLAILLIYDSCEQKKNSLSEYTFIIKTFDKSEILDLNKILVFFDNQLNSQFKSGSIIKNYSLFNKKSREDLNKGQMYLGLSYSEQKKFLETIKKETFNEIWGVGTSFDGKDTLEILNLRIDGKYVAFLKAFGKENSLVKKYVNDLLISYDITPEQSYLFVDRFDSFNFNDKRVRLMMAVHYITLSSYYGSVEE